MYHHVDYEKARRHPEKLGEMTGRWITRHDPEQYGGDNWEACVKALATGSKVRNTNLPTGYEYKPWSIDELLGVDGAKTDQDEGDWS